MANPISRGFGSGSQTRSHSFCTRVERRERMGFFFVVSAKISAASASKNSPLIQSPQRDAKSISIALSERSFSSVGNLDPLRIR
jgi:hypothetical protein